MRPTPAPTLIEVFADVGCPFTHVGLRRFVEVRAERGRSDVTLLVRGWPLEVVNGSPLDPELIAEEIEELRAQVAPDAFTGFATASFPSTSMPALALAAAANRTDPRLGEAVSLTLRDLLFEQGVDIADVAVLADVAEQHGITVDLSDDAPVRADHAAGLERGVVGSPHFFTPSGGFFCPALDVRRDEHDQLHISVDGDGFERFIAACFT